MKLYGDMNIYNRCFDDQNQLRIKLETAAIEGIFALAEAGKLTMVWSFMLDYENSLNPHQERKEGVKLLSQLCRDTIAPSSAILRRARSLIESSGVKPRDALHLACAENAECDYFITCDDALIGAFKKSKRGHGLKVVAINPVEFMRREGIRHGQS